MSKTVAQKNVRFYYAYVFVTGAAVMVLEFAAARVIAPWFGTSIFVWGNVIGVILIALSLGYWIGGKIADRFPDPVGLMRVTMIAGAITGLIPLLVTTIGSNIGIFNGVITQSLLITIVTSFITILILFAGPIFLLGMVSPYVIRLATHSVKDAGTVAGSLYAASTLGSIVGTFGSAFFLVPVVGSRESIALSSFALILIAIAKHPARKKVAPLLAIPIIAYALVSQTGFQASASTITEVESQYQYIRVEDQDDRLALVYNEGIGTQSVYMKDGVLTGAYYDYLALTPFVFSVPEEANVAVLGLAGGTITRQLTEYFPNYQLTGIEIDPAVIKLAREYFHLDEQNVEVVIQDARQYVRGTDKQFDMIIIDAFSNEYYIPWHMTTDEFYREIEQVLTDEGVISFNVGSLNEDTQVLGSILETLQQHFTNVVYTQKPGTFNYVVMASDAEWDLKRLATITDERSSTAAQLEHFLVHYNSDGSNPVLTDNRAPLELYTEKMVLKHIYEQIKGNE